MLWHTRDALDGVRSWMAQLHTQGHSTARTQTVFLLVFDIENTVRHERKPDMSVSYVIQWGPEERRQNGFDSANRGRECCLSASRETTASARTSLG